MVTLIITSNKPKAPKKQSLENLHLCAGFLFPATYSYRIHFSRPLFTFSWRTEIWHQALKTDILKHKIALKTLALSNSGRPRSGEYSTTGPSQPGSANISRNLLMPGKSHWGENPPSNKAVFREEWLPYRVNTSIGKVDKTQMDKHFFKIEPASLPNNKKKYFFLLKLNIEEFSKSENQPRLLCLPTGSANNVKKCP